MDREKCMKIVIEQLNQIKPLMSIDPEVSLLEINTILIQMI